MQCASCGQVNDAELRFCVACGAGLVDTGNLAAAGSSDALLPAGTVLKGTYEVVSLVGEGGAGAVYAGRHVDLGHPVAIKVLFGQLARLKQIRERFVEEGRIQANLRHPNIVNVSDIVDDGQIVAIVMEFIRGETLHHYIQRHKEPIPLIKGAHIVLRLLTGLQAAHDQEIVHRDIKPGNVMLAMTPQGIVPKLCDFGIAKVASTQRRTITGTKMGTLHYMAPEQFQDARRVDRRADIYAMGVTFYELLTGNLPFDTDNDYQLMRAHVEIAPPSPRGFRPDMPRELEALLLKTLAKKPDDRFANCTEMAEALVAVPGFDQLRRITSMPGVPITDDALVFPDLPEHAPAPRPTRARPATPETRLGPRTSLRPSGSARRVSSDGARTSVSGVRRKPASKGRMFPLFLLAFAAALVAVVAIWLSQRKEYDGAALPGSTEASLTAGLPKHEEDALAGGGNGSGLAHRVDPTVNGTGNGASLDAVAACEALVDELETIGDMEQLAPTTVTALATRLQGVEQCRDRLVPAAGNDPFGELYGQTQAERLVIARNELRAYHPGPGVDRCQGFILADQAYDRAVSRLQSALDRGELRPFEVDSIRELGESMVQAQAHLQTRFYECRLEGERHP